MNECKKTHTRPQLMQKAKSANIKGYSKMTKDQLCKAIESKSSPAMFGALRKTRKRRSGSPKKRSSGRKSVSPKKRSYRKRRSGSPKKRRSSGRRSGSPKKRRSGSPKKRRSGSPKKRRSYRKRSGSPKKRSRRSPTRQSSIYATPIMSTPRGSSPYEPDIFKWSYEGRSPSRRSTASRRSSYDPNIFNWG